MSKTVHQKNSTKSKEGIKKNGKLNIKLAIIIVLAVALVGGFMVFKSSASGRTFEVSYAQADEGGAGVIDRTLLLLGDSRTFSKKTAEFYNTKGYKASGSICAYFRGRSSTVRVKVSATNSGRAGGDTISGVYPKEQTFYNAKNIAQSVCTNTKYSKIVRNITVQATKGTVGLIKVYGRP